MWWTIICKSGKPLRYETGDIVLLPSVREAANWMVPSDLRVERWNGGVKPAGPSAVP